MADNKYEIETLIPVKEFIFSLDDVTAARIAKCINLLEIFGARLKMPHSKKVNKEIYELRARGKKEIRIFYSFINGKVFLLHGFIKKTQKLPSREIELAKTRLKTCQIQVE